MTWDNTRGLKPKRYTCGYCNSIVATAEGYISRVSDQYLIYICPNCDKPTYFEAIQQIPGISHGNDVEGLSKEVESLYKEARKCISVSAYTSSVLACRKLLMHIAVDKGAQGGLKFIQYVEHLSDKGYVPPGGKDWVDHIRKKGNEANHEIKLMSKEDAEELVNFAEMLLKFMYEFTAKFMQEGDKSTQ